MKAEGHLLFLNLIKPLFQSIMKKIVSHIFLLAFLMSVASIKVIAQPPMGRPPGGGGFDPDEMVKREKQNVYKAITDLSDDQKLLLDGIYDEFSQSFKELREEMMKTRDFQAMRPKMEALRDEKDGLIKDVLNEDQYNLYLNVVAERRRQRGERGPGNPPEPPPSEDPQ